MRVKAEVATTALEVAKMTDLHRDSTILYAIIHSHNVCDLIAHPVQAHFDVGSSPDKREKIGSRRTSRKLDAAPALSGSGEMITPEAAAGGRSMRRTLRMRRPEDSSTSTRRYDMKYAMDERFVAAGRTRSTLRWPQRGTKNGGGRSGM